MRGWYNVLRRACAFIVGLVFVVSGTFKLMDPVGTSLIVGEYWNFFHLGFMRWSSYAFGVCLALLETGIGLALATGVARRVTAVIASVMMAFFTVLTVILAIFNPSFSCGCFGEVIHLTHLQTLLKNLALDALCCLAFLPFRDFGEPRPRKYVAFGIGAAASILLLVHTMTFLPVRDYTDFKPGSQLLAARSEAESTVFQASFIYEKDGVQKVFTLDEDLPDSSWTFVRTETVGTADKAADLAVRDLQTGEYVDSIAAEGDVLIVSYYRHRTEPTDSAHLLLENAREAGYTPLCLTAGKHRHDGEGHAEDFCYGSDRRTLMALNRSNGGATLIRDGLIVKKWSRHSRPTLEELEEYRSGEALEVISDVQTRESILQQAWLLCLVSLLVLM